MMPLQAADEGDEEKPREGPKTRRASLNSDRVDGIRRVNIFWGFFSSSSSVCWVSMSKAKWVKEMENV